MGHIFIDIIDINVNTHSHCTIWYYPVVIGTIHTFPVFVLITCIVKSRKQKKKEIGRNKNRLKNECRNKAKRYIKYIAQHHYLSHLCQRICTYKKNANQKWKWLKITRSYFHFTHKIPYSHSSLALEIIETTAPSYMIFHLNQTWFNAFNAPVKCHGPYFRNQTALRVYNFYFMFFSSVFCCSALTYIYMIHSCWFLFKFMLETMYIHRVFSGFDSNTRTLAH